MADQSDVEAALAGIVGGALYPGGLQAPCAAAGAVVRIYRGWPVQAALDADLAAGRCNVSISASGGAQENTSRWPDTTLTAQVTPTLFASVAGVAVTFTGAAPPGQVAAVIADAATAAYRTQTGDTLASVAAALAALLAPQRAASATGAVLTVPNARRLVARVEVDAPTVRLTGRRQQEFKVSCWCHDPYARDAVGRAIDAALSGIDFITLPDGTAGRLRAVASSVSDRWEDAALYRRELTFSVDYPSAIVQVLPRMAIGIATQGPAGRPEVS